MARFVPKATQPPKIERISNRDWLKGIVTAYDDGRTPIDGLRSGSNITLEQNGTVRPRPSLVEYGPPLLGAVLGELFEFTRENNGVREFWLMSMQVVNNEAKVYVAKGEDSTWTECTGSTYDDEAAAHYLQIDNKVLIMNGIDSLSFVDTADFTITKYTELDTPAAPTLDNLASLSGTNFKVYYAVTANSTVGETDGSPVLTQSVSTDRDMWNPDTQSVTIKWTTVTGVKSWNVYMGVAADGAGQPKLYCIASGIEPGTLKFTDNGTRQQDVSRPLPTDNGTSGPKAKRGCVSNGRVWLVGDGYKVWRGGDYGFELDFSPANGGGFTPVGNGTKEKPVAVKSFRNGKGDAMLMVLSQGTNGSGKRYYLNPTNVTYGSSTFVVWQVTEDSGEDGTDSPDGLVIYQNSAYYPSRDGFKTTGTRPQLQNILSTDKVSNTIQTDISTLNSEAMNKAVGVAYENRIYWALPVQSNKNSQIWVLDLERKGAWTKWHVPADWITLYNDNSGRTHFLAIVDGKLCEFSYSRKTSDIDKPFLTSGQSGQIRFSEDGREWGRLIQLIFVLLRPQGEVTFTVSGKSEDGLYSSKQTYVFAGSTSRVGWSEPKAGWSKRGWSKVKAVPKSYNEATKEVIFEVDEDLQWFDFGWYSTQSSVDYSMSEMVGEYVNVGIKDLA